MAIQRIPTKSLPRKRSLRVPALSIAGIALLVIIGLGAISPTVLTSWGPTQIDPESLLVAPGTNGHLLGTDSSGMDILSRLLHGARFDLAVALAAVSTSVVLGSTLGALVGLASGWVDEVAMRVMDAVQALPSFIAALVVATVLGPSFVDLVIALAVVSTPNYVRLMRAEVRTVRAEPWVDAAKSSGVSWFGLLFRQIVPNALRPIFAIAPLACGWAILALAALSFVGLGVQIPDPEWGAMIASSVDDLAVGVWWTSIAPGSLLFLAVLGFNLTSEGFQEAMR